MASNPSPFSPPKNFIPRSRARSRSPISRSPDIITMSSCGNCDCADKSQCTKKGNGFVVEIVEADKSYYVSGAVEGAASGEHDGKCQCGSACSCTDCKCGK